jgi:hypothetical protein
MEPFPINPDSAHPCGGNSRCKEYDNEVIPELVAMVHEKSKLPQDNLFMTNVLLGGPSMD